MDEQRLKPQIGSGPGEGFRMRLAMQMGAAMGEAQADLLRPTAGEEAAELAGRASRAAVAAFLDMNNPETPGFSLGLVAAIAQQAYATEWARLANNPREQWRA